MRNNKKTRGVLIITLSVLVSAYFIPWQLLALRLYPLQDTIQEEIELLNDFGMDGTILYIDKGGDVKTYTTGWKDRDAKIEAQPDNLFKIASISKLYIASAAAMMVDQGLIDLEASLADVLPKYVGQIDNAHEITIRMLIGHRSGIPNYVDHDYPWDNPPESNEEIIGLVLGMPADFEPDSRYSYSNTNYLLMGEIMDKALGYSHHRFVREEILTPLNLDNTYSLLAEVDLDDLMSGYFVGYEHDVKDNDFISPGGSMVATAEDVGIFLRALNDGSLLTENQQAIYTEIYEYGHTGLLPGYQSIAWYMPDMDAVVVLFNNTSGGKSWSKTDISYRRILRMLRRGG